MHSSDDEKSSSSRRAFLGASMGAAGLSAAALVGSGLMAQQTQAQPPMPGVAAVNTGPAPKLFRAEIDLDDCEVDGKIPEDLSGAFYRVGPDPQYPLAPGNIPFDGEGHVSMFRIKNGHASYKTRFVRNERWQAQHEAGRILFPKYRNPSQDDPSVVGLSRSTANTHIINHRNLLLALKEDSPPSALDLNTLDIVDPVYTFDGQLNSAAFTAHPKVDSETGNIVAFGYESTGFGSDDVTAFEITPSGKKVWEARVKVPYVGMLHDFAVTQNYIILYVIPMVIDHEQMKRGGIHWAWDPEGVTWLGAFRRDGDGSDIRWFEGPHRSATHVMGAWDDKGKIYIDVEMSLSNPFPFMPMQRGAQWDPVRGTSHITRLSADLNTKRPSGYSIEQLAPWTGALPRQDDRYNTMPYRYGFLGTRDINASDPRQANAGYVRFDHSTGKQVFWNAGAGVSLAECCFAPKSESAAEGEGYLMGLATRNDQGGRGELVILDAQRLEDGPLARVMLPVRAVGQIHGWWVPESQMPVS
jgi:carotenoid cleavage dioxygenase-like enzyme